jgi:hypothetical protein
MEAVDVNKSVFEYLRKTVTFGGVTEAKGDNFGRGTFDHPFLLEVTCLVELLT